MNRDDTYAALIEVLDAIDGVTVVTEGGWNPPCIVVGAGGWQLEGSHWFPVILIDLVLDGEVTDNYALNLIHQQAKVIGALIGQSYLAHVTPGASQLREHHNRQYIVARTSVVMLYDD